MGYQQFEPQGPNVPPWLQRPFGAAWLGALGYVKDLLADRLRQGLRARFASTAPPDSLRLLGIERGIVRGALETDAAYAGRVKNAWSSWLWAGTPYGLLLQLAGAGYTSSVLMSRKVQYTLDVNSNLVQTALGAGGWVTGYPNANAPLWSTFSLIIPHPWPTTWLSSSWTATVEVGASAGAHVVPSGTPASDYAIIVYISGTGSPTGGMAFKYSLDNGATWSGTVTPAANSYLLPGTGVTLTFNAGITYVGGYYFTTIVPPNDSSTDAGVVRAIVKAWKPAFATCTNITVLQTGKLIGYPIRTLGSAAAPTTKILGGCSVTSWTPPT